MIYRVLLAVALLASTLFGVDYAAAQASFTAKDASGTTQTFTSFNCTAQICALSVPADSTGAAFGVTGNPFFVTIGSGKVVSGAFASGSVASGAFASGSIGSGAMVDLGAIADAAATVGSTGTLSAKLRLLTTQMDAINTNIQAAIPAGTNTIGTVGQLTYPVGATPITASATGTTAATTATLAGTSGKTTYICGYSIRANATAAATVTNTITGVITATLSSIMWVAPAASGIGIDEQIFSPCIPASGTNTGIAIVSGAPGTGGAVSSKGWGYQL